MSIIRKRFRHLALSKDLGLLLLIGGLYSLSVALSNTFVNIFLWRQSGQFIDLAVYNLTAVIFELLSYIAAGQCAKKVDRVVVLRMGVLFLGFFYVAVLFIGNQAADWIILLGALLGVGYGFYWLAYNVLTFEITEPETRDFFNGFFGSLLSMGGMIGPIVAGFIISRFASNTGYFIIFGASLGCFFIAVLLSLLLKRRPSSGRFQLLEVWKERDRHPDWKRVLNAHFFQGLREGVFVFVISVFVFVTTGSELALGTYGLVYSGVSFFSYSLAVKLVKKQYRKKVIFAGGIVLFLSLFLIIVDITFTRLLIYAAIIAIAYPFLLVPYLSMTYDVIGRSREAAERRVEYIVVREVFINVGRIVSILSFIVAITLFDERESIPVLLVILGAGHSLIYLCIRKVNMQTVRDLVN